jgi:NagD protein
MAMVGDRLYTDVATGVNHGLTGILVLSGEATLADLETSDVKPDLIFGRLSDMIPYLE